MSPENSLSLIVIIVKLSKLLFFINLIVTLSLVIYKKKKGEKIGNVVLIGTIIGLLILFLTGLLSSLSTFSIYNLR